MKTVVILMSTFISLSTYSLDSNDKSLEMNKKLQQTLSNTVKKLQSCNKKASKYCRNTTNNKCLNQNLTQIGRSCINVIRKSLKNTGKNNPMMKCMNQMGIKCSKIKNYKRSQACMQKQIFNMSPKCKSVFKLTDKMLKQYKDMKEKSNKKDTSRQSL